MAFTHIHCSSRFDRPVEALESDLDDWMGRSSLITLTEVGNNRHAARMREKGWNYFNAKRSGGADEAGIAWKRDVWSRSWSGTRKLHSHRMGGPHQRGYVHACASLLKHSGGDRKLLVMVAHMPAHVQGHGDYIWRHEDGWRRRKAAYQESMKTWSTWTKALVRSKRPNAVLVVADWNWGLKDDWFREYLKDHWGNEYQLCWKHFPTMGSMGGHSIIDGTLAANIKVVEGATLMHAVRSSDHRPYTEKLDFAQGFVRDEGTSGHTREGRAWWGWKDYDDDTEYQLARAFEDE